MSAARPGLEKQAVMASACLTARLSGDGQRGPAWNVTAGGCAFVCEISSEQDPGIARNPIGGLTTAAELGVLELGSMACAAPKAARRSGGAIQNSERCRGCFGNMEAGHMRSIETAA
jgi:hypothetical protein